MAKENEIPLEILVATMNRNSFEFLHAMFQHNTINDCKVLVINQTTKDCLLESNNSNIRVINSFEKGLSRSRNLAIRNAKEHICLLADDDVIFEKGFAETVLKAFRQNKDATLITFKALNFEREAYRNYESKPYKYNLKSAKGVISIEIAFNCNKLHEKNIFFNERFGLGSEFTTGEEYLFLRKVIERGSNAYFYNAFIVSHDKHNSGKELGSERITYSRAALNYKIYKQLAYFWLFKYLYFLVKEKYIKLEQVLHLFKIGLKGIKDFKKITS